MAKHAPSTWPHARQVASAMSLPRADRTYLFTIWSARNSLRSLLSTPTTPSNRQARCHTMPCQSISSGTSYPKQQHAPASAATMQSPPSSRECQWVLSCLQLVSEGTSFARTAKHCDSQTKGGTPSNRPAIYFCAQSLSPGQAVAILCR